MLLCSDAFFHSLKQKHYAHVPFKMEPHCIDKAIDAFFAFLNEPDEVKNHIDFSIAPNHRRGDVGFKKRQASDHMYNDDKAFFHYHPALLHRYSDFLAANPLVKDFLLQAHALWEKSYQIIADVLSSLDTVFPGVKQRVLDTETPHLLLRFLKYDWAQSGKYLAKPHFDAGSMTLAIAESSPGLRIGSAPHDLQLVEHKKNHAIFMFSSNMEQLIGATPYKAGWHDVIQLDASQLNQAFSRWAIVAFIEAHGASALPRSQTHKWHTPTAS